MIIQYVILGRIVSKLDKIKQNLPHGLIRLAVRETKIFCAIRFFTHQSEMKLFMITLAQAGSTYVSYAF